MKEYVIPEEVHDALSILDDYCNTRIDCDSCPLYVLAAGGDCDHVCYVRGKNPGSYMKGIRTVSKYVVDSNALLS